VARDNNPLRLMLVRNGRHVVERAGKPKKSTTQIEGGNRWCLKK
jgi:hypothetical protein